MILGSEISNSPKNKNPKTADNKQKLLIKSFKNVKELKGLYDFTSKKNKINKFHVLESVILGTEKKRPFCIGKNFPWETLETKKEKEYLISISKESKEESEFTVDMPGSFVNYNQPKQETWVVVGTLKSSQNEKQMGFELSVGDVIKMGREQYRIAELRHWFNEDKDKIMEHSTYYKNVQGKKGVCVVTGRYCTAGPVPSSSEVDLQIL
jgi:hypothetical protein